MQITATDFEEFWSAQGRYLRLSNPERWHKNMVKRLQTITSTEDLDDYVLGLRTGKESTRLLVVEFYNYLGQRGKKPLSPLYQLRFYDNPIERQLEIAKFLHNPHTSEEIQSRFGIDSRTMRSDLKALEDGITVFGATVQITAEKIGRKKHYRTTCHPIFLPLNLTEVYAMTVYLNHIMDGHDSNSDVLRGIARRIKGQLSDYAYERIFPDEARKGYSNDYIDDEEMAQQREHITMYLMKSGQPCRFFFQGNEYVGRVRCNADGYCLQLEDGTRLDVDPEKVDFIIESLEYK